MLPLYAITAKIPFHVMATKKPHVILTSEARIPILGTQDIYRKMFRRFAPQHDTIDGFSFIVARQHMVTLNAAKDIGLAGIAEMVRHFRSCDRTDAEITCSND